ncbi:MAG: multiheme c-type cytochrome [Planctomycetota bacterium]|nr:multiheme c-type cytochrome [Planctomycetota bacterium]
MTTQRRLGATRRALLALLVVLGTGFGLALAEDEPKGLPDGPTWGRGRFQPTASNVLYATADGCALCHSAAPEATALRSDTGDDVSPYGLWQATMMANAYRDPYWRAQVASEGLAAPEKKAEIEALCLRCHGPMAHHTARIAGEPVPSIADGASDPLAVDGVSCTVCHQVQAEGLGTAERFDGQLDIRPGRVIYGPYADPVAMPMRSHSAFTPTKGSHIRSAALCGSCHTLTTKPHEGHGGFVEQAPYLEWRNSLWSTEGEGGPTKMSRTCQECHMADLGTMRIARNPPGRDFYMDKRPDVRGHAFVGGNSFMLRLLRENRKELGVTASERALERMEFATRRFLKEKSADLTISPFTHADGRMKFTIDVRNKSGHKLPTGYPSRRVWLHVQVRTGRTVLFETGGFDERGALVGVEDERAIPHITEVKKESDVVVYEAVPLDGEGRPTTLLHAMDRMGKDSRLLPMGWRKDGPHAKETAPVGTDADADFRAGGDTVRFDVPCEEGSENLLIVAWLRYQPIPPSWVQALRSVDAEEAKRFVRMYDELEFEPEVLDIEVQTESK